MNGMLVSAAEISNVGSVLTVIIVLIVMMVFILRSRNLELANPVHYTDMNEVSALLMEKISNPFVLKLHEAQESSLTGITCIISCQKPCILQTFWGASATDLGKLMVSEWNEFKESFLNNGPFAMKCLQIGSLQHIPICHEKLITLMPPKIFAEEELGEVPRTRYPVVIFMAKDDVFFSSNEIASMISIIHVKDSTCLMETCVLMQYLRTITGQVSCLKPLYIAEVATDETATEVDEATIDVPPAQYKDKVHLCIVCQSKSISRVLLPCRHTCICSDCFVRIDKCPMCRSIITSYFCIAQEVANTPVDAREPDTTLAETVEHHLRRLNSYLGFT